MILIFEISLDYALMPALMLACVMATLAARRFHKESVYSEAVRDKGVMSQTTLTSREGVAVQRVGDLMEPPVPPVRDTASLQEIAGRFLSSPYNFLPVVDTDGRLVGVVALHDLKEHLSNRDLGVVIAYDLMRPPPPSLIPSQRIVDALPVALASEQRRIPVVNSVAENRLIGSLPRAELLSLLSEAIATRSKSAPSS
jgi:CIC family chloride channel protein